MLEHVQRANRFARHCGIPGDAALTGDAEERRVLKAGNVQLHANGGNICLVDMQYLAEKLPA